MNREQRRAAKRKRKTTLPVHILNSRQAKASDYAERQYLSERMAAAQAEESGFDQDTRERIWQYHERIIDDLVYCRDADNNAAKLRQMVLEMDLLSRFYDDLPEAVGEIAKIRAAETALQHEEHLRDGSPNQRRALLSAFNELNDSMYAWIGIAPPSLLKTIDAYITAVKLRRAIVAFYSDMKTATAAVRLIRGESLRALAKEYGLKENVLKEEVLRAAHILYAIGVKHTETAEIQPAASIPALRSKDYRFISEPAHLQQAAFNACAVCQQFEQRFGVVAGGDVAKAERALMKKLH